MLRSSLIFLLLLAIKYVSRLFYRVELIWIGHPPADRWSHHRLVVFLNHTSLFEPVFASGVPNRFLWRIARHGVVPAADKTVRRPIVGKLFKFVARHVIPITRERDQTWSDVLRRIDPDSMVIILPEGRMKRRNGLDKNGQPMTVRGGVVDIMEALGSGRMLLAYSGGLHHVQAPGEHIPRVFKSVRMKLELLEIDAYSEDIAERSVGMSFKRAVINDLEQRREQHCTSLEAMNR